MTRSTGDSPAARALRAAGYVKLPGLWVTQEQYDLAVYMARQNLDEVNRIKRQANGYDDRPWERNNR